MTHAAINEAVLVKQDPAAPALCTTDTAESVLWAKFRGYSWSERSRDLSSWVWPFGFDIQNDRERRWVCKTCVLKRRIPIANYKAKGTQNIERHLDEIHKIRDPTGKRKRPSKKAYPSIADHLCMDRENVHQQAIVNSYIKRFDRVQFQKLVVSWVVERQQSFREVESGSLRAVFEYLNPSISVQNAYISHDTVRRQITNAYDQHKQTIIQALARAPGQIHVSFDGWRSRNRHALYGICAFFRDENNRSMKVVLGLPEIAERHFGETIGAQILSILFEFKIEEKVGYSCLDNAANNDTAMETIADELSFEPKARRGHYFGHIMNLVAKAILFGKGCEAFEADIQAQKLAEAEHELWMKKGPVGKLHNLVVWIRGSDTLTNLLRKIQQSANEASESAKIRARKPLDLIMDNDTRWLSQLFMMRRARLLRPSLETLLFEYKQLWEKENLRKDGTQKKGKKLPLCLEDRSRLTVADWNVIDGFIELLEHFENTVLILEGDGQARERARHHFKESYGNITDVVMAYEYLLSKLEEAKEKMDHYAEPEHFRVNVQLAWEKLNEYYDKLDDTPMYYASLAFHPAFGWNVIEREWETRPEWVQNAKKMVKQVWDDSYSKLEVANTSGEPVAKRRRTFHNKFSQFKEDKRRKALTSTAASSFGDEYECWLLSSGEIDSEVTDAYEYWHSLRSKYPRLSIMALDFLSIPPMSAECERLFSAAGRMVAPIRSRLEANIIGMAQCLRSWLRSGLVDELGSVLLATPEILRDKDGSYSDEEEAWLAAEREFERDVTAGGEKNR
ncbi:restless-like transposase [Purpureocillium lavendulum]|uniref:Restless-like transposase n=1 Tax=Purpureocillium lavendulum TaxID=1247861 RepID=A0AB34FKN7_9HYPO|nr:restless-like transposase [Purpureocillium lavendulum]